MRLVYTQAQEEVFFKNRNKKFVVVAKGRRVGLTRGAAQAFIELSLTRSQRFLWGETIYGNVQRYIDLYFMPILKRLPKELWSWHSKLMQMRVGDTTIDFRSADNPEMWEGFGYNLIYLNEAGIILRDPDLYKKTVLPMLMDFPDSQLIAAGVPKGKKIKNGEPHPFFQLWEAAASGGNYARLRFSSYTNPFLNKGDIELIASVLDQQMKLQEIDGEFVDVTDNPYLYAFSTDLHTVTEYIPDIKKPIWLSFDFNIEPNSCIIGQKPTFSSGRVFDEISVRGGTEAVCDRLLAKYSDWISKGNVFVTGDATGNSRNAMSGSLTNYLVIKRKLRLRDAHLKYVRSKNMELSASRTICNGILSRLDVGIVNSCQQTISDCMLANVDDSGELIKDTGMHKLDCFRYMLDAWFPGFLERGHKYDSR